MKLLFFFILFFWGCASNWPDSNVRLRDDKYNKTRTIAIIAFRNLLDSNFSPLYQAFSESYRKTIDSTGFEKFFIPFRYELGSLKEPEMKEHIFFRQNSECETSEKRPDHPEYESCMEAFYEFFYIKKLFSRTKAEAIKLKIWRGDSYISEIKIDTLYRHSP